MEIGRSRAMPRMAGSVAALLAWSLLGPTTAQADWYSDAKDVIQQLIEDNIASTVVPNAASHVPVLCTFFPSSLAVIQQLRFSGLPVVVRREVADAVGYRVLLMVRTGKTTEAETDVDPSPVKQIRSTSAVELTAAAATAQRAYLRAAVNALRLRKIQVPVESCAPLVDGKPDFSSLESVATTTLRKCEPPQDKATEEVACSVALMVRDFANGETAVLDGDVRRVTAALVAYAVVPSAERDELRSALSLFQDAIEGRALDKQAANVLAAKLSVDEGLIESGYQLVTHHKITAVSLEVALGGAIELLANCDAPICKAVKGIAAAAEDTVPRFVRDVQSKNYGAAAGDVIDVVVKVECTDVKKIGCSDGDKLVREFVRSLAVYVVDSATSSSGATSSDADFHKAAVQLIESVEGPGVRREPDSWRSVVMPELALRDGARPGHLAADGRQTAVYPSIDVVTGRLNFVHYPNLYVGAHISLLDALGPFDEIATRTHDLNNANNTGAVFLAGFFTPRVDLELAIPSLSKNLVVGAGTGFHLYRAALNGTMPEYCFLGSTCAADGKSGLTWDNFELSVFVKYLP